MSGKDIFTYSTNTLCNFHWRALKSIVFCGLYIGFPVGFFLGGGLSLKMKIFYYNLWLPTSLTFSIISLVIIEKKKGFRYHFVQTNKNDLHVRAVSRTIYLYIEHVTHCWTRHKQKWRLIFWTTKEMFVRRKFYKESLSSPTR